MFIRGLCRDDAKRWILPYLDRVYRGYIGIMEKKKMETTMRVSALHAKVLHDPDSKQQRQS